MLKRSLFLPCETFWALPAQSAPFAACCHLQWGQPKLLSYALQREGWELPQTYKNSYYSSLLQNATQGKKNNNDYSHFASVALEGFYNYLFFSS